MYYRRLVLLVLIGLALPLAARASVLLEVNISNPAAVTFTPTTAFADNEFLAVDTAFNGVTLLDFFSGNVAAFDGGLDAGSIDVFDTTDGSSRQALPNIWVGVWPGGWTTNDLSFYEPVQTFAISFLTTAPALVGAATHDLTGFTGLGANRSGDLVVGEPDSNSVIGQWRVVPAPSTAVLLALGLLLVAAGVGRRGSRVIYMRSKPLG
ncbi:MAG: hypothetical protein KDI01_08030 [Halioglobus sp.]|nr:hypothetical protein [Halioglobus sp.]